VTVRVGVVVFPGTNCEFDVADALRRCGAEAELVWHRRDHLTDLDAVVLPGGFAHGDYLRTGAIARFSPVMQAVARFADDGGPVVGICNGFQVLCESRLLPGALQKNAGLKFLCQDVEVEVVATDNVLTAACLAGDRLVLPINHFEGNYTVDADSARDLAERGQIVLRYCSNPNGSVDGIAAVSNAAGNVVGLMPHPERAVDPLATSTHGQMLWKGLLTAAGAVLAGQRRS
jgi:phosphoribosylformylglycinamidine synthase subunit PurQ / glutaminase